VICSFATFSLQNRHLEHLLTLRNQPRLHVRGHKYTLTKPRCTGQVRQCFLLQELLLTYGTIYLLTQQTLAVCASFVHQLGLVQATCLDFVQFILSDAITV